MKESIFYLILFLFIPLYQNLAQNSPISPKWIFEPWVWEDETNTKDAAESMVNNYILNGIPVGAIIIDSPWEAQENDEPYNENSNNGYNTFKFDTLRYNHPDQFIQELNNQNIHVILWITGVIDTGCQLYQEAKDNDYFVNNGSIYSGWWKGSGYASLIDFFNPDAVIFWESLMDRALNSYNIEGWKVDESDYKLLPNGVSVDTYQGSKTKKQYSDAYYSEMYNYIKSKFPEGMITARPYCDQHSPYYYSPVSVNTAGWVGDQYNSWAGLTSAINNVFISANAGYAAVGFDIGGYFNNYTPDRLLFLRWAQLGALVPIMENGGEKDNCHQPWLFNPAQSTIDIYKYFATLHHELVSYLYSYDIEAHSSGTSIIRPIGTGLTDWENKWEYKLGDNLFISSIYQNSNSKEIHFPDGSSWINYWNDNDIYEGGTSTVKTYSEDQYPVFVRSGAIIPLNVDSNITGHGSAASKNYLTLLIYPDGLSSFQYNIEPYNSTTITCNETGQAFTISFSKNTDSIIIRLKNNIEPENVYLNGGEELVKFNSFSDFEIAESGWFRGKINENENIYTWIKFSSPSDTVYVTNNCNVDLYPAGYELSNLVEGGKYYIDRDYILNTVPNEYKGFNMIKTANADKANSNLDFHFNVCSTADIYIAYDHRLSLPSWIISDNYINTGKTISVSDSYLKYFDVWKRTVQPGTVHFYNIGTGIDSSMYFVFYETFSVYLKVYLQGPYAGHDSMYTQLRQQDKIPNKQPYSVPPWNYAGTDSVSTGNVPIGAVDWVLVELRTSPDAVPSAVRAAFLMSDGNIFDTDGSNHINFSGVSPGEYYIVIKHRNHLSIMSSSAVSLPNSSVYDFTDSESKAFTTGPSPMANLGGTPAKYGMYSGDANGDGSPDSYDSNIIWKPSNGQPYNYLTTGRADYNLDGGIDSYDSNLYWRPNNGKGTQVPHN